MKPLLTLGLLAAAVPLAGCGLFKDRSAALEGKNGTAFAAAGEAGTYFTQLGRRELDAGRIGLALEAFDRALAAGEEAAPALNGMGVAYARLGKYEAAHRLFSEAAARDPGNEKYAANLARLMDSPAFAMRHEADMATEMVALAQAPVADTARAEAALGAVAAPAVAAQAQPAAPTITTSRSRLVRVGANEFRIHSAAAQPAPVRSALSAAASRFKPLASVTLGNPPAEQAEAAPKPKAVSLTARPRTVNLTGFKPEAQVDLTGAGNKQAGAGN